MKLNVFLALLLLVVMGCGKTKNESNPTSTILGTWRLVGFGDEQGNVREVNPTEKECKNCYTITFKKDKTLKGYSTTNEMGGTYDINGGKLLLNFQPLTEAGERIETDGNLYVDLMSHHMTNIEGYEVKNNRLVLKYKVIKPNTKKYIISNKGFLLFNKNN